MGVMPPVRRPRLSGAARVSLADTMVVVLAALITAGLALVVEDVLPMPGPGTLVVPARVGFVIVMVLVLLVVLRRRSGVRQRTGTLFYVQMLDVGMRDKRAAALKAAATRRMSTRSLARWVDLTPSAAGTPLDVVADCRELGFALEAMVNADRDDTGYTIAPNLLWPLALAVGAHLPAHTDMTVVELPVGVVGDEREIEFPLDSPASAIHAPPPTELDHPTGDRVGVWLAFTESAARFSVEGFAAFGVATAHKLTYDDTGSLKWFDHTDMLGLPAAIADHLVRIKESCGERELVVVAMIPKAVALAVGWHLAQRECRFLSGTHLMNFAGGYQPIRVSACQPTAPPRPDDVPPTELRNLTPYPLTIITEHGTVDQAAATRPPRIAETANPRPGLTIDGVVVSVADVTQGTVENLPDPRPGILLVVSRPVAAAQPLRRDLVVPFGEIRDDAGRIIGCRGVAHINHDQRGPDHAGHTAPRP